MYFDIWGLKGLNRTQGMAKKRLITQTDSTKMEAACSKCMLWSNFIFLYSS